jgi:hypothetical protein
LRQSLLSQVHNRERQLTPELESIVLFLLFRAGMFERLAVTLSTVARLEEIPVRSGHGDPQLRGKLVRLFLGHKKAGPFLCCSESQPRCAGSARNDLRRTHLLIMKQSFSAESEGVRTVQYVTFCLSRRYFDAKEPLAKRHFTKHHKFFEAVLGR